MESSASDQKASVAPASLVPSFSRYRYRERLHWRTGTIAAECAEHRGQVFNKVNSQTVTLQEIQRGLAEAGREAIAVAPTRSAVEELEKIGFARALTIANNIVDSALGTGIHGRSSLRNIVAEVGGVPAHVEAAAKSPDADPGMDYISVIIPHTLKGSGEVPVAVTVDGFTANVVTINLK